MKNTISLTKHIIEASGTIQELDVSVSEGWLSNYFLDIKLPQITPMLV